MPKTLNKYETLIDKLDIKARACGIDVDDKRVRETLVETLYSTYNLHDLRIPVQLHDAALKYFIGGRNELYGISRRDEDTDYSPNNK